MKGKGAEQTEIPEEPISVPEKHVGAKAGRLALLERALKLKKKTEAYVSELVFDRPCLIINSIRSVDGEPINPSSHPSDEDSGGGAVGIHNPY